MALKSSVDSNICQAIIIGVFPVVPVCRLDKKKSLTVTSKIRSMMPKARVVRLAQRESGLATETIRRVQ